MTWQPIKTAPRDGQFFIGANVEEAIICNWPQQAKIDYAPGNWRRGRGEWSGSFIHTKSPLTHWQPLPGLPVAGENSSPTSGEESSATALVPVPVSERLPGPEDCDAEGRCWWLIAGCEAWALGKQSSDLTHWLPAHALPILTTEPQP